eukprot:1879073-Amphidinium_carterae.2
MRQLVDKTETFSTKDNMHTINASVRSAPTPKLWQSLNSNPELLAIALFSTRCHAVLVGQHVTCFWLPCSKCVQSGIGGPNRNLSAFVALRMVACL